MPKILRNRHFLDRLHKIGNRISRRRSPRRYVSLADARRSFERAYVEYVIGELDGDRRKAATQLGIGFSTLKTKIRDGFGE